jgi:hypothetical protein
VYRASIATTRCAHGERSKLQGWPRLRRTAWASWRSVNVLSGHIREPGDRGGSVDPVIGPIHGDERVAEITKGGLVGVTDVLFCD